MNHEENNRRVELLNYTDYRITSCTVDELCHYADTHGFDTVAMCNSNSVGNFADFYASSKRHDIRPLFGASFFVHTPEDCLAEYVEVICFARNQNGINELSKICDSVVGETIEAETLWKYSQDVTVGFDLSYNDVLLLAMGSVFEHFIIPHFVLIDDNITRCRPWENAYELIKKQKSILVCATANGCGFYYQDGCPAEHSEKLLPMKSDAEMLEAFAFLGDEAEKIVIENTRKIADMS